MKFKEFNDIKFYYGENAQDNWNLLDLSVNINPNYIWFHLDNFPSCYVIMYEELENLEENQKTFFLNFGANLCKQKSKYRNFNNLKIIYTKLNKLKKTENTGEVIVSGQKNTITI